ncbi:MAG: AsmA family protein [Hyphomonadaceae bacterium]|nr:AsmA family protein [Hyphomonadaceae bacterium]
MSWKRVALLAAGSLVTVVLLGAGVLTYLVLRLDVRGEIERNVEAATGRDLTINGPVGVSYWPVLGLKAQDVTLANVENGRAPSFIAADEIDIGVELRPLLDRQVNVRRLVFQRPRVALEVDANGQPNWLLRPRASTTPPPTTTPPSETPVDVARTSLRSVRINDGEVSFFDARQGAGWVVGEADITTALTSLNEPMRAQGTVRYNDREVEIDASIARPGAAARGELTQLVLNIQSELLTAEFRGQTVATSGELAGTVRASGPSLRQLASWTGTPLQNAVGLEQFAVTGRLTIGGGAYTFSNAGFAVDQVRGRGDFVLSELREKPYLSGRLELFDFDLNPYISGQAPPPPTEGQAEVAAAMPDAAQPPQATAEIATVEAAPRAVDVRQAPSETPIDFSGLKAFNADLELVTHAVLIQHMRVEASRLNLVLNDGYMAATVHNVSLYGGSGRGRFEIDAREPVTRMTQDLAFSNLEARRFLTDAINYAGIEGRAELSLNVRVQGRTQSEMINSADGYAHIEVVTGILHGVDMGGVATTIRNALRGELIAPEAQTPFQGLSATFAIADGVLASDSLSMNTTDLRIPGLAIIDLPNRRLDARLAPRSPRGGVVVPFAARGPFGAFTYTHDISGRALAELTPRVAQVEAASRASARAQ